LKCHVTYTCVWYAKIPSVLSSDREAGTYLWIVFHNAPLFMKQPWLVVYHFDS